MNGDELLSGSATASGSSGSEDGDGEGQMGVLEDRDGGTLLALEDGSAAATAAAVAHETTSKNDPRTADEKMVDEALDTDFVSRMRQMYGDPLNKGAQQEVRNRLPLERNRLLAERPAIQALAARRSSRGAVHSAGTRAEKKADGGGPRGWAGGRPRSATSSGGELRARRTRPATATNASRLRDNFFSNTAKEWADEPQSWRQHVRSMSAGKSAANRPVLPPFAGGKSALEKELFGGSAEGHADDFALAELALDFVELEDGEEDEVLFDENELYEASAEEIRRMAEAWVPVQYGKGLPEEVTTEAGAKGAGGESIKELRWGDQVDALEVTIRPPMAGVDVRAGVENTELSREEFLRERAVVNSIPEDRAPSPSSPLHSPIGIRKRSLSPQQRRVQDQLASAAAMVDGSGSPKTAAMAAATPLNAQLVQTTVVLECAPKPEPINADGEIGPRRRGRPQSATAGGTGTMGAGGLGGPLVSRPTSSGNRPVSAVRRSSRPSSSSRPTTAHGTNNSRPTSSRPGSRPASRPTSAVVPQTVDPPVPPGIPNLRGTAPPPPRGTNERVFRVQHTSYDAEPFSREGFTGNLRSFNLDYKPFFLDTFSGGMQAEYQTTMAPVKEKAGLERYGIYQGVVGGSPHATNLPEEGMNTSGRRISSGRRRIILFPTFSADLSSPTTFYPSGLSPRSCGGFVTLQVVPTCHVRALRSHWGLLWSARGGASNLIVIVAISLN